MNTISSTNYNKISEPRMHRLMWNRFPI